MVIKYQFAKSFILHFLIIRSRAMTTAVSESDVKNQVETGAKVFTRVFDCLYLQVTAPNRASWHFRFQTRGKRIQMKLGVFGENEKGLMEYGSAIKEAIDLKAKALNGDNPKLDIARRKFSDIQSVDDLAELYLKNKAKKIKTIQILERLYKKEIKPAIGHMLLTKVHPFDIYEIIQKVLSSGRPSIANKVLHLCKNIFKLGVKNCFLDMNPAANYSTSEDAGGNMPPRDVALTEEEIEIMFDVFREYPQKVPEPTYIGITLLIILGLRKMELFSAKWIDVDLRRQYFHLYEDDTKTKKSLAVPLPDIVLPLFHRLKELSGASEFVFPARKRSSRGYISDDTTNHSLAALFGKATSSKKAGRNVLGQAGVTEFVVHDLRRTCRTLMASLKVPQEVAEKALNHNASNIVRIYNRYEYKEERKEAHEKVAKLILPMAGFSISEKPKGELK